jgi:hypothetical protein
MNKVAVTILIVALALITNNWVAYAIEKPTESHIVEQVENQGYFSPGIQFGPNAQEISFSLGRVFLRSINKPDKYLSEGTWYGYGISINMINTNWTPTAGSGFLRLYGGGWTWEWWPSGFEIGIGGIDNSGNILTVGQISYIAGLPKRFELFVTAQEPIDSSNKPTWYSDWLIGIRYGFPIGKIHKERFETFRDDR